MKSDKEKSKILHMGRIKMFIATTGNQVAEQELLSKGTVDSKFNRSQDCE